MIRINTELLSYIHKLKKGNTANNILEGEVLPGKAILVQRTKVFSVYIIKSGLTKCYLTEDTGADFIQEFFGEGEVFGEIEVLTNDFSFCTVQALTTVSYFKIEQSDFLKLLKEDSVFNALVLQLMATKIRYTALRHSYNQSHALEDNLKRLLKDFPDLLDKISKADIANYLGITVRSLNRVLRTDPFTPNLRPRSS